MRRDQESKCVQILCKVLVASVPPRGPSDKPYLAAWVGEQHGLPAEVRLELAETVIESLLYEKTSTSRLPEICTPERWQEMMTMRTESLLLRLESVLARAAGKAARSAALEHRNISQLIRHDGERRRSAVLQELRP